MVTLDEWAAELARLRQRRSECCDACRHSKHCRWLLGNSYSPAGPCDWDPSRFVREELAPFTDGDEAED